MADIWRFLASRVHDLVTGLFAVVFATNAGCFFSGVPRLRLVPRDRLACAAGAPLRERETMVVRTLPGSTT